MKARLLPFRRLAATLAGMALLASCTDTPIQPGATPGGADQARSSGRCLIQDDAATKVRTVSSDCTNAAIAGLPDGWTLRVQGATPASGGGITATAISPIENPDGDYVANTQLIDISGIADFTLVNSVTDGTQTVTFSTSLDKRTVPLTWGTWGDPPFVEPGTPHILYTQGATSVTMTLSVPASIFGFELGANPFALHTFTAQFYSGAELVGSITREIHGDNGARLMAAMGDGDSFDRVVVTGTADFAIGRIRYAEGETTSPIAVAIDDVYSGDPRQAPGTISLEDQWVYVEILDVQQYIPTPATANDVRIGQTWQDGVPADAYTLTDLDSDGDPDIRVRFSLAALRNAGLLPVGSVELTVWGRRSDDGQLFRGVGSATVVGGGGGGELEWDNGSMVTHPGAGAGGADVSMAEVHLDGNSVAGSNVRHFPPGSEYRIADDFTVAGEGGTLNTVTVYAYETGSSNPFWTRVDMNIRSGSYDGAIVASATTTSWTWSGIYRVFNGAINLGNTDRPVQAITFDFGGIDLAPGTYWIDWQVVGGISGWAPYVMIPNRDNPNAPTTQPGNGVQLTPAGWQPLLVEQGMSGVETPFLINLEHGASGGSPLFGTTPKTGPRPLLPAGYEFQKHDVMR